MSVDPLEKKIQNLGDILQNFGLNLIQSIGEMKHSLATVIRKTETIEAELIELKALKNQLQEVTKLRSEFLGEMARLKAQLNGIGLKIETAAPNSENSSLIQMIYESPKELLNNFDSQLTQTANQHELLKLIKDTRDQLFILTGGHTILFDLRSFEKKLKNPLKPDEEQEFRRHLQQKIEDWKKEFP